MSQPKPTSHSVLVIGAGPSGLAAAASLRRLGVPFRLVDRHGRPGGAYRHIYPAIVLQSPARYMSLPGLVFRASGDYASVAEYRAYLDEYALHHELHVDGVEVERIERCGSQFSVRFVGDDASHRFAFVVVATGMYDFPIIPAIKGLTSSHSDSGGLEVLHGRQWKGPERFQGRRLLIVGGATAGIEIAEQCARIGLTPTVSARSGIRISKQRFLGRDVHDYAYILIEKLPVRFLGFFCDRRPTLPGIDHGFEKYRRAGLIQVRSEVERFEGKHAVFAEGPREEFDAVVLATGYRFEMPFLPPQVRRAPAGHPLTRNGESRSWRGLFFVGVPCERTLSSEYLRGIGQDAAAIARRIQSRVGKRI